MIRAARQSESGAGCSMVRSIPIATINMLMQGKNQPKSTLTIKIPEDQNENLLKSQKNKKVVDDFACPEKIIIKGRVITDRQP